MSSCILVTLLSVLYGNKLKPTINLFKSHCKVTELLSKLTTVKTRLTVAICIYFLEGSDNEESYYFYQFTLGNMLLMAEM